MNKAVVKTIVLAAVASGSVHAAPIVSDTGWVKSDRFGYSGTITRYSDAELNNQIDTIDVTDPDLSLYTVLGISSEPTGAVAMGSWWYSTAVDSNGEPKGAGWGNSHGNTGAGFMQYYNYGDYKDTSQISDVTFGFDNFDGTHWTDFSFSMNIQNGDAVSRLSAPSNSNDGGVFLDMNISFQATGLEGLQVGDMIQATGEPGSVSGSISGIFTNTQANGNENNPGYYAFDFDLNMDNWAYENRDNLVGNQFPVSEFAAQVTQVPAPSVFSLLGLGLAGLALNRRRKSN